MWKFYFLTHIKFYVINSNFFIKRIKIHKITFDVFFNVKTNMHRLFSQISQFHVIKLHLCYEIRRQETWHCTLNGANWLVMKVCYDYDPTRRLSIHPLKDLAWVPFPLRRRRKSSITHSHHIVPPRLLIRMWPALSPQPYWFDDSAKFLLGFWFFPADTDLHTWHSHKHALKSQPTRPIRRRIMVSSWRWFVRSKLWRKPNFEAKKQETSKFQGSGWAVKARDMTAFLSFCSSTFTY